jgi:hypothetical protein
MADPPLLEVEVSFRRFAPDSGADVAEVVRNPRTKRRKIL